MDNTTTKKNFATGWLIVVACMLLQAIPFGVASNIQPQFVSYVVDEYKFTLAGFSLIFTLGTVASAVASPFIGSLFNKVNTKVMFTVGCILSGGGFLAFSFCNKLWEFYIIAAIVQIGTATFSAIGVPLLISRWFDEASRGKAMGLAFAGSGLGNIFLQFFVTESLANFGPSRSYLMFGALSLIVGIPISLFLIRMPHNDNEIVRGKNASNEPHKTSTNFGYTFKEATKLKYFWLFGFALFFLGMYVSALAVQYPAYLKVHLNLDPSIVGNVGSIFAFFCLFGNLFGGAIFDKLGTTKGLIFALILAFVSFLSLMYSNVIPQLAYVFAILKGLSVFANMIGPSLLTGSFFGQKEFGAILGVVQIFFAVGFAAGSSVFGLLVDNLGYTVAWYTVLAFIFVCYLSLIATSIGMEKLKKEKSNTEIKEAL